MAEGMSQAQFTYTMTGIIATTLIAFDHLRWRNVATYYDAGAHASMNYWKIANFVQMYSGLGIMGLATLTQLLALMDVGVSANIMVWTFGVGLSGSVMNMISMSLLWLARDAAYVDLTSTDLTKKTNATIVYGNALSDMLNLAAFSLFAGIPLYT